MKRHIPAPGRARRITLRERHTRLTKPTLCWPGKIMAVERLGPTTRDARNSDLQSVTLLPFSSPRRGGWRVTGAGAMWMTEQRIYLRASCRRQTHAPGRFWQIPSPPVLPKRGPFGRKALKAGLRCTIGLGNHWLKNSARLVGIEQATGNER
jgi:hypothetical protein